MSRHVEIAVHPDELPPKLGIFGLQSCDLPLEVVPLETGNGLAIRESLARYGDEVGPAYGSSCRRGSRSIPAQWLCRLATKRPTSSTTR
jgi:hypothetical protein